MEYLGLKVGDRVRLSSMGGGEGTITEILYGPSKHPFQVLRDNASSPLGFWGEELTKIEPEEPKEPTPQDWADRYRQARDDLASAMKASDEAYRELRKLGYVPYSLQGNYEWRKQTTEVLK